jgi:DNA (cytosine-5)-methyltransferase 1
MIIDTGSDFSGVGAFDQALSRLGIKQNKKFACDWDKFARQTYIYNYGEPDYYPSDVYDREIPETPLDIYMTSPPCQSFSLAGKRQGENSDKGVLFYNSHEFIVKNKPRYFIFENVKGLLSDNNGKTFQRWLDMLGGKSVNGNPVIFPHEESTPYHIYYQVMNAKQYGVPQNRERVFIIGIRDDENNNFSFPKTFHLVKRLKDVLESDVDEKYFLSDKMVTGLLAKNNQDNGFSFKPKQGDNIGNCITARCFKMGADDNYIEIHSNTKKGYDVATENDSINFSVPSSETRRGRVGKGVAQTLDTACNQGVVCFGRSDEEKKRRKDVFSKTGKDSGSFKDKNLIIKNQEYYDTLLASPNPQKEGLIYLNHKIRRLTPKECFRLMDFNEDFKWNVSDSQAYKQAGNSIVVSCLVEIIKRLDLRQPK